MIINYDDKVVIYNRTFIVQATGGKIFFYMSINLCQSLYIVHAIPANIRPDLKKLFTDKRSSFFASSAASGTKKKKVFNVDTWLWDVEFDRGCDGHVFGRNFNLNPGSCRSRAGLVVGRALVPAGVLGLRLGNGDHRAALVVLEDLGPMLWNFFLRRLWSE